MKTIIWTFQRGKGNLLKGYDDNVFSTNEEALFKINGSIK